MNNARFNQHLMLVSRAIGDVVVGLGSAMSYGFPPPCCAGVFCEVALHIKYTAGQPATKTWVQKAYSHPQ